MTSDQNTPAFAPPLTPLPAASAPGQAFLRVLNALILREIASRYGRTPGGFLCAVAEPVAAVLVLTFALSMVLNAPSLGTSFVLFYASGYLPFLFYATLQAHVQQALVYSRPLLVYPSVSWFDAIAARFLLNLVTGSVVVVLVLAGLALVTGEVSIIRPGLIVLALALAAIFGLGLGVLNCLLIGLFPLWGQVWGIISRPLFLVAGVIFVIEDLPRALQEVLVWTPWIHITGLFRAGLYPGYDAAYASPVLVLMWGLIPLTIGLAFLRLYRHDILQMP